MSLKLLLFGNRETIESATNEIRGERRSLDEEVQVETLMAAEKDFVVFSIPDRGLIASQATGSDGLIFFLDPKIPLHEEKEFLFELLSEKSEFDGLPVVIAFEKEANIAIKDVINYFELYKVKDRPSMIKEISSDQVDAISDAFKWVETQVEFRRTSSFDALPKVVKVKPKYRESNS